MVLHLELDMRKQNNFCTPTKSIIQAPIHQSYKRSLPMHQQMRMIISSFGRLHQVMTLLEMVINWWFNTWPQPHLSEVHMDSNLAIQNNRKLLHILPSKLDMLMICGFYFTKKMHQNSMLKTNLDSYIEEQALSSIPMTRKSRLDQSNRKSHACMEETTMTCGLFRILNHTNDVFILKN